MDNLVAILHSFTFYYFNMSLAASITSVGTFGGFKRLLYTV